MIGYCNRFFLKIIKLACWLPLLVKICCNIKNIEVVSAKVLYLSKKEITLLMHCLPAHAQLINPSPHYNMNLSEKKLVVKESMLPGAGKGLFTEEFIEKGLCIIEYKGTVTTWKNVDHDDGKNAYIFYVNRNHVTDAKNHLHELARYVNDAKGIKQVKGISNNAEYVVVKKRIFIYAIKNIAAGAEIFVGYGKGYWDTIRAYIKEASQRSIEATV